ncbi:hypothetical protein KAI78_11310 [bacterium]|nr:hypothetical protein [bacterium]
MSLKWFKTLLGWSPGAAGLPVSGCVKENKEVESVIQRELATVGSSIISSWFLFYTSHLTLQTAFIVGIDSNLKIPLSSYL